MRIEERFNYFNFQDNKTISLNNKEELYLNTNYIEEVISYFYGKIEEKSIDIKYSFNIQDDSTLCDVLLL